MPRTYIFTIIALLSSVFTGCTAFYSDSSPCVTKTPEIDKVASQASDSNTVVPDLPRLEPIQLAQNTQSGLNTVNDEAPASPVAANQPSELPADELAADSYLLNPFANGEKIVPTPETSPVDKPNAIQVVRLPQAEPAVVRTVSGKNMKSSVILPTSFEAPNSPTPEVVAEAESVAEEPEQTNAPEQWRRASGEEQAESSGLLSMTPGVLDIDKQTSNVPEPSAKSPEVKVALLPTLPEEETSDVDILLGEPQSNISKAEVAPLLAEQAPQDKTEKSEEILQCSAAEALDDFEVHSLAFVTAIRRKGDFSAVEKPYTFASGQTLLAYMEIENPQKSEKLKTGFEITDSNGKKVFSQDNASDAPAGEVSFFQYVKFALPEKISAGQYTLRVWGKPSNADTVSSSSLQFKVE